MEPTVTAPTDDPELREILSTLTKPVYPFSEITKTGPFKATKAYEEANAGRIKTFLAGGRRQVLAIDYARYLLLLRREGAIKPRETPLSGTARDRQTEARNRQSTSAPAAA